MRNPHFDPSATLRATLRSVRRNISVRYNPIGADFEVEMVLVGEVLLITRHLPLGTEFLTTSTDILARSVAFGTRAIPYSSHPSKSFKDCF